MAQIFPFRGLTYNPGKTDDFSRVVAPPYDVISPEHQAELYDRSPRNVVRIDFCRDADPYETVPRRFREWQKDGTLVPEDAPAIYYLSQEYRLQDGSPGNGAASSHWPPSRTSAAASTATRPPWPSPRRTA